MSDDDTRACGHSPNQWGALVQNGPDICCECGDRADRHEHCTICGLPMCNRCRAEQQELIETANWPNMM